MSKDSSAKYYHNNKERLQKKKLVKDIKIFLKKKKRGNIAEYITKIFQKLKNKSLLSIEKNIRE